MNGVRRLFATTSLKSPQSGQESSQLGPLSPSNVPVVSPESHLSLVNALSQSLPHNIQANTLSPAIRENKTNNLQEDVNGAFELNKRSHHISEDVQGELGSDPAFTHYMNKSYKAQIPPSPFEQPEFTTSIRDDLLLSLLTSEVIVDSRDYEILTIEEFETLKEEQHHLTSRMDAVKKKLSLELKIRDVSQNLQKLNASGLDTESSEKTNPVKLNVINAELTRTLEQLLRVDRRLLQHQSAVLSQSVRSLERQLCPENFYDIFPSGVVGPRLHTRTSFSSTSNSTRTKFEGAHLFAGHALSVLPASSSSLRPNYFANKHRLIELDEKLKASDSAQKLAQQSLAALEEECERLRQQNVKLEKSYELQLSNAHDMINDLESSIKQSSNALQIKAQWEQDKKKRDDEREHFESQLIQWDLHRKNWEANEQNWHVDRQRLKDSIQSQESMIVSLEEKVNDLSTTRMEKERLDQLVLQKDDELRRFIEIMEQDRASWQAERVQLEDELERAQTAVYESDTIDKVTNATLAELREILEELIYLHEIPHDPQDKGALNLLSSVRNYLISLTVSIKHVMEEKTGLEDQIHIHESDLSESMASQERLRQELEELRLSMVTMPEPSNLLKTKELPEVDALSDSPTVEYLTVVNQLKGLWALLPSVESRAPRLSKSGPMSPSSPSKAFSLSDLDVRALKSLYDPKQGFVSPVVGGQFNIGEFVRRVHALINDDRALIERLLRFAQSHDLLRSNAERAQRLAQESNKGLEMYQLQVRTLEERNSILSRKQLTMLDEISNLQQSMDILMKEKQDFKSETMEQASVIQRLTEVISANDRTLPQETPMSAKSEFVDQLSKMQTKLQEAQDEVKQLRSIETSQRVALLNELNSLQQENSQLRDQLRSRR